MSVVFLPLMLPAAARADDLQQAVEISGEYQAGAQNPDTEKPYFDARRVHAGFNVVLCGEAWKISATNLETGETAQIWSDGADTYTMEKDEHSPRSIVTISPGRCYLGTAQHSLDCLDLSFPWLTYCVSPDLLVANTNGILSLPIPWAHPRVSAGAYGYKWLITPAQDGTFIGSLTTVRDHALDRFGSEALLRSDYIFPGSVGQYNSAMMTVHTVDAIPDGWPETKFESTAWFRTNGISIPAKSEIQHFIFAGRRDHPSYPHPVFRGQLNAVSVQLLQIQKSALIPQVSRTAKVYDFRYRRANETRIYRFAEYTLKPGESWKSDVDPKLLAQAEHYLKHGPRYDAFLYPTKRNYIAWLPFGAVVIAAFAAILWYIKKQSQ